MKVRDKREATIEDLYKVPEDGKAEIIGGELVLMSPTQWGPNVASLKIAASLDEYAERERNGYAFTDNMAFIVDLPGAGKRTFSPDAAYYLGALRNAPGEYVEGVPTFAAEVRSQGDYGAA